MVVQIGTEFVGGICASGPPKALLDETCRPASKFVRHIDSTSVELETGVHNCIFH